MIPPLAWVPGFTHSLSGAIGTSVSHKIETTQNPLIFKITLQFGESISGKRFMLMWNLFQQYAHKNESIPQGKLEKEGNKLTALVGVKRRLGLARDEHPLG